MSSTTVQTQIKLDELPAEKDDAYALEVSLLSFDNELYDYYSVLNLIYDAYSGFSLPSNVSGGKGFVGIFIPSTIVLEPWYRFGAVDWFVNVSALAIDGCNNVYYPEMLKKLKKFQK